MKKISVMIPCYNEEENVEPVVDAVIAEFKKLNQYDYEICFAENCSTDNTRQLIRNICKNNKKVKAIFNARNFGQFNSPYYAMLQLKGDCVITLCCDFQDPPEMIPKMIAEWENGAKIVSCIKTASNENKLMRFLRSCYYKIIRKMSDVDQIEHFTGFGLYDKDFIEVLRNLHDPTPFLRGIVAELGFKRTELQYTQAKRKAGKTHNNWYTLYDAAMLSFTSYTKVGLRLATIGGAIMAFISMCVAIFYFVYKCLHWDSFSAGIAPLVIGVWFLGALQLFFIGFLGEYIMSINTRIMNRPLVIEEERINWE